MVDNRFQQQVVLITGAGRGLGRAIAVAFGQEGARLAINDLTPVNLDETQGLVEDRGAEVLSVTADISKKMQVQRLIEAVRERFGRLDILINNAGVRPAQPLLTMDEWDWDRTLAVNLKGPFLTMQSGARVMAEQGGGKIVNLLTSQTRGRSWAKSPAFAATKDALLTLTRAAAIEFAPLNIRVNAVGPGNVIGDSIAQSTESKGRGGAKPATRPWVPAEAVADAVLYLCSEEAAFVTGEVIYIDGGGNPE